MIWGGISLREKSPMVIVDGNLNAQRYIDQILDQIVHPIAERYGPQFVLMDDKARPHRANVANDFLHAEGISRMDPWPANSPDLNPIEQLWDQMGREVNARVQPVDTLQDLQRYLQDAWTNFPQERIVRLIRSMRRRCTAVITSNDGYT